MTPPRVAVVGAGRRRQGLGPFVLRDLVRAGAEVPCLLTRTAESGRRAAQSFAAREGREIRAYDDFDAMLGSEQLDAVAILSPAESHRAYLEAAAAAGLHTLCEKPLVWGEDDLGGLAERVIAAFDERQRLLFENCQWPYTLPAFESLHPGALVAAPREFEMELQPSSRGRQMLGDCLPHVLSLLQTLVAGDAPALEDLAFSTRDPQAERLEICFRFRNGKRATRVRVSLCAAEALPRSAAYALDGRWARREVSLPDYRLSFRDRDRSVDVPDPLGLLVAEFVGAVACGAERRPPGRTRAIGQRMRLLAEIVDAYERVDRSAKRG